MAVGAHREEPLTDAAAGASSRLSPLRIGTRKSTLAVRQAERVRALLEHRGVAATLVPLVTSGDRGRVVQSGEPAKGLFTKEIELALLDGRIDAAVHSLKDLLTDMDPRLVLAAYPEREDPRDALVSRTGGSLETLPPATRVGTSSPRRRAAVLAARPDLIIVPLTGNVTTRIDKIDRGDVDAAVLAVAGLARLELLDRARPLEADRFVPAAGQGALAVQVRAGDRHVHEAIRPLDDPEVRVAVEAERAALRWLEAGCRAPVGALCTRTESGWVLRVEVYATGPAAGLTTEVPVSHADPEAAGRRAAIELLGMGAAEVIASFRAEVGSEPGVAEP